MFGLGNCYIKMHNATKIQLPLVCHHSPLTRRPGLSHAAHKLRIPDVLKTKTKKERIWLNCFRIFFDICDIKYIFLSIFWQNAQDLEGWISFALFSSWVQMNLAARCYGLANLTNKYFWVEIVLDKKLKDFDPPFLVYWK